MRHITPTESGYWVRFHRLIEGRSVCYKQRLFTYSRYKKLDDALDDAIKWRDKFMPVHKHRMKKGGGASLAKRCYQKLKANNTTGHTGIRYREHECDDGTVYMRFVVTWAVDGKPKQKSFGFKHDFEKALMLKRAIRHRKRMEALHYVGVIA